MQSGDVTTSVRVDYTNLITIMITVPAHEIIDYDYSAHEIIDYGYDVLFEKVIMIMIIIIRLWLQLQLVIYPGNDSRLFIRDMYTYRLHYSRIPINFIFFRPFRDSSSFGLSHQESLLPSIFLKMLISNNMIVCIICLSDTYIADNLYILHRHTGSTARKCMVKKVLSLTKIMSNQNSPQTVCGLWSETT